MSTWDPTLCFRRFREKHTELGNIYWTHMLGVESIMSAVKSVDPDSFAYDHIKPAAFLQAKFPMRVRELPAWFDIYAGRVRLHVLLVCAANLEAYLKDITLIHLLANGHAKSHLELNAVGAALGSPILSRQSLPAPLEYAEELFDLKFGAAAETWGRSYRLRCALAHNGGVVTARTIREIPDIGIEINEPITLSWETLLNSLKATDAIVTQLDRKVASPAVKRAEIGRELQYLKDARKLPAQRDVWKFLSDKFGFKYTKKSFREFVGSNFYRS